MSRPHSFIHSEKEDEKRARAAIKAQIEADKQERAQKAAQEKALREGNAAPAPAATTPSASAAVAPATTTTTSVAGRDFKETRLQIRLASGGPPLTTTLPSDSSCVPLFLSSFEVLDLLFLLALREVAEFVAGQTLTVDVETVTFTQQFPRCVMLTLR